MNIIETHFLFLPKQKLISLIYNLFCWQLLCLPLSISKIWIRMFRLHILRFKSKHRVILIWVKKNGNNVKITTEILVYWNFNFMMSYLTFNKNLFIYLDYRYQPILKFDFEIKFVYIKINLTLWTNLKRSCIWMVEIKNLLVFLFVLILSCVAKPKLFFCFRNPLNDFHIVSKSRDISPFHVESFYSIWTDLVFEN